MFNDGFYLLAISKASKYFISVSLTKSLICFLTRALKSFGKD